MTPELSAETVSAPAVSRLMAAFRQGDKQAASELVEMFYPQLRRLASSRMKRERAGHSWQATLLVNELYLELVKIEALPAREESGKDSAAFFGLAAHLTRRLLIHHSRPLQAKAVRGDFDETASDLDLENVTGIEQALSRLEALRPRLRAIVELKAFEGMTTDEVARRLGCSTATVTREWNFARHCLQKEMALSKPR